MSETSKNPAVTEEFRKSITDFVKDILFTFPEYKENLEKWIDSNTEMSEFQALFEHCFCSERLQRRECSERSERAQVNLLVNS